MKAGLELYAGELSPASREGVTQTLKRLNWTYGRGDVDAVCFPKRSLRVRLQFGQARYAFTIMRDAERRLWIRFRGRTRIVRHETFTFREVA